MNKALILLSGGQDSTTCLYWAKTQWENVAVLNIRYGQRHLVEIASARRIAKFADVSYSEINTDLFQQVGDSVLVGRGDISAKHRSSNSFPASFVPGRNIVFLTIAAMVAYKYQVHHIVTGVSQVDFSNYPDCREQTIQSLEITLTLAMNYHFTIHTPLMHKTKKETVEMAMKIPRCHEALAYSHTCYEGEVPPCGKCPACVLRAKGFLEAGIPDPLILRLEKESIK